MMLRIICRSQNCGAACNVPSAHAELIMQTFEVHAPECEAWLRKCERYQHREVIGVEVCKMAEPAQE